MGIDDWSSSEAQNAALGKYDVSRGEAPNASTSEHTRVLMAEIKALSDSVDERFENFVGENIEVDGVSIVNNDGTLTVVDVAIGGDTEDLLTDKIAEIEAAAETASGKASDAATAAEQAAASASAAVGSVSSAVDAANTAAAQASLAAQAAGHAQAGAAVAESAVQAVVAQANLNWQKSEKASSVAIYPVPETALEPVIDFLFTETGPETGTKSLTNPSEITGVSSVSLTHCETSGVESTTYNIDLNGTFYSGSFDVASGTIEASFFGEELTESKFSTVGTSQDNVTNFVFITSKTHAGGSSTSQDTLICNRLATDSSTGDFEHCRFSGAGGGTARSLSIYIDRSNLDLSSAVDPSNPTTSELKRALFNLISENPIFIVYKTYSKFFGSAQSVNIKSLPVADKYTPRVNTITSDQAYVQVGYAKSPIATEEELLQKISELEV